MSTGKVLFLFDVDGTLTAPRLKISEDMTDILSQLAAVQNYDIGFVGGSDLSKQQEQLGETTMNLFTWKFAENGLVAYHKDELINKTSLLAELTEDTYQELINTCLRVISETTLPIKRGHFIELRNGMINISPIGRSCSQTERLAFYEWDKTHHVREQIIESIKTRIPHIPLSYSIGGQISIDIFPQGWDKTYCLQFIETKYTSIHFFGDKTDKGGNDYELYNDSRVTSYSVKTYKDTIRILQEFL
jgi:phosphomannomutase